MQGLICVARFAVETKMISVETADLEAAAQDCSRLRRSIPVQQMSLLLTFRQLWDLWPIACGASVIGGGQTFGQYNKLAGADSPLEA